MLKIGAKRGHFFYKILWDALFGKLLNELTFSLQSIKRVKEL